MVETKKLDVRAKRTQEGLCEALAQLLTTKSIADLSVGDICEKANIHRTTFYKHFKDKYDLFEHIIEYDEDIILSQLKPLNSYANSMEYYSSLLNALLTFVDEKREQLNKIIKLNNDNLIRNLLYDTLERAFIEILRNNKHSFAVPEKIVATFFVSGFVSLLVWWLTTPNSYSKEQIIDFIELLIGDSIV